MLASFTSQLPALSRDRYGQVGLAVSAVLGTALTVKVIRGLFRKSELEKKRRNRQQLRQHAEEELAKKLATCQVPAEKQKEICSLNIKQLQEKLQSGELKAIEVLRSYQVQAIRANQKTNAIIEYVSEAEDEAALCDEVEDRSGRILHGIPVSIKECFPMLGYDVSLGLTRFLDQPWEDDCVIVKVLREQGAIPFVRTNVPQTMISFDTCNPIYGQTRNPHNLERSAGGSSGGEAALQAAGGSIIGLGGDIGGSIRIPASFCGTYGLKPTSKRISTKGCHPVYKGQNLVTSAYGPMTRDVDGLVLMMKALLSPLHFQLDKTVPPVPFRDEVYNEKKKLKIGYYLDDGIMVSTPHMKRAVTEAVQVLKSLGHDVVEWKFDNIGKRAASLWTRAIFSDGGREIRELTKNDKSDHAASTVLAVLSISKFKSLYNFICKLISCLYPNIGHSLSNFRGLASVHEWHQLTKDISAFRAEVLSDIENKDIDVILAPGFTTPAMPVGSHRFAAGAASYTVLYNVLDFPAGSMPVTSINAEDNAKMADYPTHDPWHKAIKNMWSGAEGLPLNIQVVSPPWHEERCLRVMKELESAIQSSRTVK